MNAGRRRILAARPVFRMPVAGAAPLRFGDHLGGTENLPALGHVLSATDGRNPPQVFVLTDGEVRTPTP